MQAKAAADDIDLAKGEWLRLTWPEIKAAGLTARHMRRIADFAGPLRLYLAGQDRLVLTCRLWPLTGQARSGLAIPDASRQRALGAFHDAQWDRHTTLARGPFIDSMDSSIVARSFPKFFNRNEVAETTVVHTRRAKHLTLWAAPTIFRTALACLGDVG
jgi:hypothetical protein